MRDAACPVQWAGHQAIVTLPEQVDVSNAGQIREELLSVINHGAGTLITDMTATISCDYSGVEAIVRAHQRAVAAGAELRLAVSVQIVRRVLVISGLDRLVSIYPSLEAAMAARPPAPVLTLVAGMAGTDGHMPPPRAVQSPTPIRAAGAADGNGAAITPAVVWRLVDALQDGVVLSGPDGTIRLANARLEEMFGYPPGELPGHPVECLIPAHLQDAHRDHMASYALSPRARLMRGGPRPVALRKDGTSFPAEISLSPVATPAGQFALAVIRDVTEARRLEDHAGLAAAAAAEQVHRSEQLLDNIISGLFGAGLSLEAAMELPPDAARQSIAAALSHLDDTIRQIRDTGFTTGNDSTPDPVPAGACT
jgi:anti-anti-sigma factor